MVLYLRADCTKLQIIGDELQFAGEVGWQFLMLRRAAIGDFRGECKLGLTVDEAWNVVDDCFEVVWRFIEFPDTLIDACLVMQCCDDHCSVYSASTSRCILKHALCFVEVDDGFVELLLSYALISEFVELIYLLKEFVCIK